MDFEYFAVLFPTCIWNIKKLTTKNAGTKENYFEDVEVHSYFSIDCFYDYCCHRCSHSVTSLFLHFFHIFLNSEVWKDADLFSKFSNFFTNCSFSDSAEKGKENKWKACWRLSSERLGMTKAWKAISTRCLTSNTTRTWKHSSSIIKGQSYWCIEGRRKRVLNWLRRWYTCKTWKTSS